MGYPDWALWHSRLTVLKIRNERGILAPWERQSKPFSDRNVGEEFVSALRKRSRRYPIVKEVKLENGVWR